jgi:hypothetical protein
MADNLHQILDSSVAVDTFGETQNFLKSDTGIIYLECTSNNSGDTVEIYATPGAINKDFFVVSYQLADLTNQTLVDAISPVMPYIKAQPTQGSWNVWVDGDW